MSPPSDSSGGPSTTPFVFETEFMNLDNIHPRIIEDMKAFDGFDISFNTHARNFMFDLPPASSEFPQMMPDIQYQDSNIYGGETTNSLQHIVPPSIMHGNPAGPPVLDATWQSFVEQLGF
jgi:hypothetical protein